MAGHGYYEHETKVRFTEALMGCTKDWQWFVDVTEDRFDPPEEIASLEEFAGSFSAIRNPYDYLANIVDAMGDFKPSFSSAWLESVYECVLLRSGLMAPEDFTEHEGFFGLLGVASFSTFLSNQISATRYFIDFRMLYCSNLHQLFDFGALGDGWMKLRKLVDAVSLPGIENIAGTLKGNFEALDVPIDDESVASLLDANFDSDFLDFKNVDRGTFQTWQEALLRDAFLTSFMDGGLEPLVRNGRMESPDVSSWTQDMLALAKSSFADERAICVLETVELAKWGTTPSRRSQEMLVNLAVEHASRQLGDGEPLFSLECTAFDVLEHLMGGKRIEKDICTCYYQRMSGLLGDFMDYPGLCFMQKHRLPMSKEQKAALRKKAESLFCDELEAVDSSRALIAAYGTSGGARYCSQNAAERSFDLFKEYASGDDADIMTAELFHSAMVFYLALMGNPGIDKEWAKKVVIFLRHYWQDTYYRLVVAGMHRFSESVSVSSEKVDSINDEFMAAPWLLAHSAMFHSDDAISAIMEEIAKSPLLYMVSKMNISEYYPEHVHVTYKDDSRSIDRMIVSELKRVCKERSYRLLNQIPEQKMIDGFYERLHQSVLMACGAIDVARVYDELVAIAPKQYVLLPNPASVPTLGHLAQLFPLLENAIRDIGEFFNIVPFQMGKASFNKAKEVTGVLGELIENVRGLTGTIRGCNEFLFVHYVMYSHNGFNIRNDCIHGRCYQAPSDVAGAYRLTVICAYMMLKRLRVLQDAATAGDE